ncbi:hypothetical protein U4959_10935 [Acinetobacter junii]|uniref:hypothetical protein n=1 Tax=Acinetobacter junii TaxID=40215 RepID=UPI002B4BDF1A|nr:hypothetical protein [Acinetobacter junii]WRL34287.1 hypothetical protein U4959_10935 [Acinetobacter junii]
MNAIKFIKDHGVENEKQSTDLQHEQAIADCEILDHPEDYTSPNCKKFDERVNSNETK